MKKTSLSPRYYYLMSFVVILILEILIALYVNDRFIRPYGGDILVVILLGCLYRSIRPQGSLWLSGGIFLVAVGVEVAQFFNFVELLGLGEIEFFRILMGTSFAWADIWSYAAGCAVFLGMDWLLQRKRVAQP